MHAISRQAVAGLVLCTALVGILAVKCYREVTMAQRTLEAADTLRMKKEYAAAADAYEKALAAGSPARSCLIGIAECRMYAGDLEASKKASAKLRAVPDGLADGHYYLALCYKREGRRVDYLNELEQARMNGSHYASILLNHASKAGE